MAKSVTLCFCLGVAFIRVSFAQDCGNPSTVGYTNGVPNPDTTENSTVTVWCATGYEGTATPATVTCQSGSWETVSGCIIISCPVPTTTTGYTTPSYTTLTYESTASVSCDTGYAGSPADIVCQADKHWSIPTGCAVDCGYPSTTGYIYSSVTTTTSGSSANVACAIGYEGTATPAIVTCLDTRLWESVTGCTIISCPIPTVPTGYTAPSYTTLTYDSTASVSCDTGYTGSPGDIVWRTKCGVPQPDAQSLALRMQPAWHEAF